VTDALFKIKNVMKTIKVKAVQPRVENVAGNKVTEFYAVEVGAQYVQVSDSMPKSDVIPSDYFKLVAVVEVEHPSIMFGATEEVVSDMMEIAEKALKENGITTIYNQYI
jgi:hypothetical protein